MAGRENLQGVSVYEFVKAKNGKLNVVSEVLDGSFVQYVATPQDIRAFVSDFEKDVKRGLAPSKHSAEEARKIASSVVGQALGLTEDQSRAQNWRNALRGTVHEPTVEEAYKTFAPYPYNI